MPELTASFYSSPPFKRLPQHFTLKLRKVNGELEYLGTEIPKAFINFPFSFITKKY